MSKYKNIIKKVLDRIYLLIAAAALISFVWFLFSGFDSVTSKIISNKVGRKVDCYTRISFRPSADRSGCYVPMDQGLVYEHPLDRDATKWRNYYFVYPLWIIFLTPVIIAIGLGLKK
jgi:hypothetical protein